MNQCYIDVCEQHGWSVNVDENGIAEIENWSPAGEDIIYDVRADKFSDDVKTIYENFDVEEHVTWLLEAKKNGFRGVPYITVLVEDAKAIENMLEDLAIALAQPEVGC